MQKTTDQILEFLGSLPVSKWGIANISGLHSLAQEFSQAISLLIAYSLSINGYDEAKYTEVLQDTFRRMREATDSLSEYLGQHGVRHQAFYQEQHPLVLSYKFSATCAGLGWVGRNCLLVTEEFGPRVTLATVLIDADLPCGTPIVRSLCGDCRACVDACPYGSLTGADWRVGMDSAELLDVSSCRNGRDTFKGSSGHRHSCGLCIAACPKGG